MSHQNNQSIPTQQQIQSYDLLSQKHKSKIPQSIPSNYLSQSTIKRQSSKIQNSMKYQAYCYAFISNLLMVVLQICVKWLTQFYPAFVILGIRGSLLFFLNYAIMKYKGINFSVSDRQSFILLLKRSSTSALTMTLFLSSVQFIPIGVASTLFNTGPLMTFFIEALYYKNAKIRWMHVLITFLCFTGITMIIQPQFLVGTGYELSPFQTTLYFLVLIAAFTGAFSMIFIHDLRKSVNQYAVLQYGYVFQANTSYMLYVIFNDSLSHHQNSYYRFRGIQDGVQFIFVLLLLVASGYVTQLTRVLSTFHLKPSLVMPLSYVTVIVGMIVDITVFSANYNVYMILGAILTSCGLLTKFFVEK